MKITFLSTALAAILGLALAGVPTTAKAQTTTTPAPATTPAAAPAETAPAKVKKAKKSDKNPYEGSITAIDASSVTVATAKKTLTLAIAPTTKFAFLDAKKKKTPATAADFAVGDKVTGSFSVDSTGAMTASSVHKKKAATAAAPAAAAPAAQ